MYPRKGEEKTKDSKRSPMMKIKIPKRTARDTLRRKVVTKKARRTIERPNNK